MCNVYGRGLVLKKIGQKEQAHITSCSRDKSPALVAKNQICIFLELGEKDDSGISLICLIRKVTSVWDVFLEILL